MTIKELKEMAKKEFDNTLDWETYEIEHLTQSTYEYIDLIIEKAYAEGMEEWEKEINKRAEKYITEVLWYTCPDFRI